MAERSFKREVEQLRIGAGVTFRGEGILAITKALLESGVGYVGGYQGAPISHLMDVLADAEDLMAELGIRFEANASEAAYFATPEYIDLASVALADAIQAYLETDEEGRGWVEEPRVFDPQRAPGQDVCDDPELE